jgi:hypothetical protein
MTGERRLPVQWAGVGWLSCRHLVLAQDFHSDRLLSACEFHGEFHESPNISQPGRKAFSGEIALGI